MHASIFPFLLEGRIREDFASPLPSPPTPIPYTNMDRDRGKLSALLKRMDEQRNAFMETYDLVRELVGDADQPDEKPPQPTSEVSPFEHRRRNTSFAFESVRSYSTRETGDDSDDDESNEEFYAQSLLEEQAYDLDGFRQHLSSFSWPADTRKILEYLPDKKGFLMQQNLLPVTKSPISDRSHYQVFDVGVDGAPLSVEPPETSSPSRSVAMRIWATINNVNSESRERKAVGRITILRELSPVLLGAAHYVMHRHFDVDEMFQHLVNSEGSSAKLHRTFETDERRRRSFIFNFEYFTLIADDCSPMPWQLADHQAERGPHHIAITRCSSVVALSLGGPPIKQVVNRSRRAKGVSNGAIYDPFAAWQVLNIQFYPDWESSVDVHDSTKHYVNGVEAFIATVLGEFKDARRRFEMITKEITKLVIPPLDFMFDADIREQLLFEDSQFTYTRRYFWAAQTLGIIGDSIKSMISAYGDSFTEEIWTGAHKSLWLLEDKESARNVYFLRKMAALRQKFETQVESLRELIMDIDARRAEIKNLREELFVGTSIQESRRSVENSDIAVLQGHNIKLLTMVSIFFLPLTFVTSVFGMTNMPTDEQYWQFGIVTACVCVPFFILVGSLNSNRGMAFWRQKTRSALHALGNFVPWAIYRKRARRLQDEGYQDEYEMQRRTHENYRGSVSPSKPRSSVDNSRAARLRSTSFSSRPSSHDADLEAAAPIENMYDTAAANRSRRSDLPELNKPSSRLARMIQQESTSQRKRTISFAIPESRSS
jgi:hypothetical protein